MTNESEFVSPLEAEAIAEVLELIECQTVEAGLNKLLGLSLEREKLDKISYCVYFVLKDINSAKAEYWEQQYCILRLFRSDGDS